MMESIDHSNLPLTIFVHHGEGFKNTNPCATMHFYVKAHIKGDNMKIKTAKADKHNGTDPTWNSQMKFNLDQRRLLYLGQSSHDDKRTLELVLKVKASSPLFLVNKNIGEVRLPVSVLYNRVAAEEMMAWTSYRSPVLSRSGRPKGAVHFSYRFGNHGDEGGFFSNAAVATGTASAPPLPAIGLYSDDLVEFI